MLKYLLLLSTLIGIAYFYRIQSRSNQPIISKLRVARPTNNFKNILQFYKEGLGFQILAQFKSHEGFDGLILGKKGMPYHFEFTIQQGHKALPAPSKDNLLVFYFPTQQTYNSSLERMMEIGYAPVTSCNPYWDRCGKSFEDADGYRVVLVDGAWNI